MPVLPKNFFLKSAAVGPTLEVYSTFRLGVDNWSVPFLEYSANSNPPTTPTGFDPAVDSVLGISSGAITPALASKPGLLLAIQNAAFFGASTPAGNLFFAIKTGSAPAVIDSASTAQEIFPDTRIAQGQFFFNNFWWVLAVTSRSGSPQVYKVHIYRSSDQVTWTQQDSANAPQVSNSRSLGSDFVLGTFAAFWDGSSATLQFIYEQSANTFALKEFDMSASGGAGAWGSDHDTFNLGTGNNVAGETSGGFPRGANLNSDGIWVNGDGIHAVYVLDTVISPFNISRDVYYRLFSGGSWGTPLLLNPPASSTNFCNYEVGILDSNRRLHVLFNDSTAGVLKYRAVDPGGTLGNSHSFANFASPGHGIYDAATDSLIFGVDDPNQGLPCVYVGTPSTNPVWTIENISNPPIYYTTITFDSGGVPTFHVFKSVNQGGSYVELDAAHAPVGANWGTTYQKRDSNQILIGTANPSTFAIRSVAFDITTETWKSPSIDSPTSNASPSITYRNNGNPVLISGQATGSGDLNFYELSGGSWSTYIAETDDTIHTYFNAGIYCDQVNDVIVALVARYTSGVFDRYRLYFLQADNSISFLDLNPANVPQNTPVNLTSFAGMFFLLYQFDPGPGVDGVRVAFTDSITAPASITYQTITGSDRNGDFATEDLALFVSRDKSKLFAVWGVWSAPDGLGVQHYLIYFSTSPDGSTWTSPVLYWDTTGSILDSNASVSTRFVSAWDQGGGVIGLIGAVRASGADTLYGVKNTAGTFTTNLLQAPPSGGTVAPFDNFNFGNGDIMSGENGPSFMAWGQRAAAAKAFITTAKESLMASGGASIT